jgi:hypothetical protein
LPACVETLFADRCGSRFCHAADEAQLMRASTRWATVDRASPVTAANSPRVRASPLRMRLRSPPGESDSVSNTPTDPATVLPACQELLYLSTA